MHGPGPFQLRTSVYPLLLSAMAGGTFVDFLYAGAIRSGVADVFGEIADALLLLALPVLLAGVLAVALTAGRVRALMVASLVLYSCTFLLPALAGLLPGAGELLRSGGAVLRIGVVLGALLLAVAGQREALR